MTQNRGAEAIRDAGAIPSIGTTLRGTYRIVRPLAEGGCGDVWVAAHTRLGSEVAVKILHPGLASAAEALDLFRQEADIMSALRHPHVVQILDFNVTERGVPFLVMELLEGRSLSQGMISGQPFDPLTAVHIIDQIAQALEAAHAHGIVHLDLKPDNVILLAIDGRDDFVKVIDFGISRARWRAGVIDDSLVTGTPEFMAPEQARGEGEEIDYRADQFSLAAVAYTLLTGREPFQGPDLAALLHQVIYKTQQPPSEVAAWLDARVDGVIERAMSKRAVDRYPGVRDFSEALRAAVEQVVGAPRVDRLATPVPIAFVSSELSVSSTGRETRRFIRRASRKIRTSRSGPVLLALAAVAAFAWFSPATRDTTRAAWQRARGEARRVVGSAGSSRATAASSSGAAPSR
jgi:eukaryotic-like serine/threonine-protein kinase